MPQETQTLSDSAYAEKVREIRTNLRSSDQSIWRAADLILEIAGPPANGIDVGLRRLAADAGITEQWASALRSLAYTYPAAERQYEVPWTAYRDVQRQGDLRAVMLERYAQRIADGRPERAPSRSLLQEVINEVRAEAGVPPRRLRRSDTERLVRTLRRWLRQWNTGQIKDPSLSELDALYQEADRVLGAIGDLL